MTSNFVHRVFARAQAPLDALYARRHPGAIERKLIRLAAPVVRRMKPNDRWSLLVHAPDWMRALHMPVQRGPGGEPRRLFLFTLYRHQFSQDLLLATFLAWRGHAVTVGYLPKLGSPSKPPLQDHSSAPDYLAEVARLTAKASGGRINLVDLSAFEDPGEAVDETFVASQAEADTRMTIARETINEDDARAAALMAHFATTGRAAQRSIAGYMRRARDQFDLAIVPNGTVFEPAHVCQVLRRIGLPFNTTEKFAFRQARVLNHGDDFRAFRDLDELWKHRRELGFAGDYAELAAARALRLMNERRSSSTQNWAWSLQATPGQRTAEVLKAVGLDATRPFVLVCTNVPWDAGYDKLCRFFPSMRSWLIETVRALMQHTEVQVVVRCHPAESSYWGGNERSEDNLAEAGFRTGGRLVVIPSTDKVNTYGLMETCKFGAVFSSTTGLEMAMMGKRVLVGADVYYVGRGFTEDVTSSEDYLSKLVAMASAPAVAALEGDRVRDACLFHFLLHFAMQWPYPYDKGGEAQLATPARLIESGAIDRFAHTLDAVAMPPPIFMREMGRLLGVGGPNHIPRLDPSEAAAGAMQNA